MVMKGLNDDEICDFVALTEEKVGGAVCHDAALCCLATGHGL